MTASQTGLFAERGTRRVHYVDHGEGAPLILVPGLGGGARAFGTLPRRFARNGFRCLSVDPVGMAPSSELPGRFDFDEAADDVIATLDATGIERCTLVGTSLGGKVALTATHRHPSRVDRLVMLASSAITTQRARRVYRFFEVVADRLNPAEFADAVAPFLFGRTFHHERPAVVDDIVRATRPTSAVRSLMIEQARALQKFDGSAAATSVSVPTLCVAGAEDTLTAIDEIEETQRLFPNARYLKVEGAGHTLLLESPRVFDEVCAFARS